MTIFLTSDLHVGHERCATEFRGFASVEEHDETLVDAWNATVGAQDVVVILGDAVMGKFTDNVHTLGRLNGSNVYLLPGNHDRFHPSYDKRSHKRDEWRLMYEQYVTPLPEQLDLWGFRLCHFPYSGDHTEEDRYVEYRPTDEGLPLLHGHVHDLWRQRDNMINVGVDVWNWTPVPLETLTELRGSGSSPPTASPNCRMASIGCTRTGKRPRP